MACEETAMQTEARFLKMLEATTEFQRERVKLTFRDEQRTVVARFAQTDWD
jgi:heat shock protein HslJ